MNNVSTPEQNVKETNVPPAPKPKRSRTDEKGDDDKQGKDPKCRQKLRFGEAKQNVKEQCAICLNGLFNPADNLQLSCSNLFHSTCIQAWKSILEKKKAAYKCPLCKEDVKYTTVDLLTEVIDLTGEDDDPHD